MLAGNISTVWMQITQKLAAEFILASRHITVTVHCEPRSSSWWLEKAAAPAMKKALLPMNRTSLHRRPIRSQENYYGNINYHCLNYIPMFSLTIKSIPRAYPGASTTAKRKKLTKILPPILPMFKVKLLYVKPIPNRVAVIRAHFKVRRRSENRLKQPYVGCAKISWLIFSSLGTRSVEILGY